MSTIIISIWTTSAGILLTYLWFRLVTKFIKDDTIGFFVFMFGLLAIVSGYLWIAHGVITHSWTL